MKVSSEELKRLENLLEQYHGEVNLALDNGYLKENTVRTYLLHSSNFIKWCNGNFEPGGRNK
ncbi:MAG: hypothetical protein RR851_07865 [Clostridium sp.]